MNNFFKRILGVSDTPNLPPNPSLKEQDLTKPDQTPTITKARRQRKPKSNPTNLALSEKDEATRKGEPWVGVLAIELDPNNLGNGSFNLDFNEIFVARLVKAGYKGKTDFDIVDQWFNSICRNVIAEAFEQEMADPDKRNDWNATVAK